MSQINWKVKTLASEVRDLTIIQVQSPTVQEKPQLNGERPTEQVAILHCNH